MNLKMKMVVEVGVNNEAEVEVNKEKMNNEVKVNKKEMNNEVDVEVKKEVDLKYNLNYSIK